MRVRNYDTGPFTARREQGGAGEVRMLDVLDRSDFETAFAFIEAGLLEPGAGVGLHLHERSEECLLVLDGALSVAHNEHFGVVEPPSVALCRAGDAHGIFNHTDRRTSFVGIGVAPEDGPFEAVQLHDDLTGREPDDGAFELVQRLDPTLLTPRRAHLGLGEIRARRLFGIDAFTTNWGFLDHALLPPGTSVGYHRHDTIQECYVIIGGRGRMKVDGEVGDVTEGDCIPNRIGGSHGIINHTDAPLEYLNIAVCRQKGHIDFTNLDDDLSDLL